MTLSMQVWPGTQHPSISALAGVDVGAPPERGGDARFVSVYETNAKLILCCVKYNIFLAFARGKRNDYSTRI